MRQAKPQAKPTARRFVAHVVSLGNDRHQNLSLRRDAFALLASRCRLFGPLALRFDPGRLLLDSQLLGSFAGFGIRFGLGRCTIRRGLALRCCTGFGGLAVLLGQRVLGAKNFKELARK